MSRCPARRALRPGRRRPPGPRGQRRADRCTRAGRWPLRGRWLDRALGHARQRGRADGGLPRRRDRDRRRAPLRRDARGRAQGRDAVRAARGVPARGHRHLRRAERHGQRQVEVRVLEQSTTRSRSSATRAAPCDRSSSASASSAAPSHHARPSDCPSGRSRSTGCRRSSGPATARRSRGAAPRLEHWVADGGQLVVIGGADWQTRTAGFADLLPVRTSPPPTTSRTRALADMVRRRRARRATATVSTGTCATARRS